MVEKQKMVERTILTNRAMRCKRKSLGRASGKTTEGD